MQIAQHILTIVLGPCGLIYTGCGLWLWKAPPKRINGFFGYRTPRAMKSQPAWDFAQVYAGRALFYCGISLVVVALLCLPVTITGGIYALLPSVAVLAFTALPIYLTERKLKHTYGQDH